MKRVVAALLTVLPFLFGGTYYGQAMDEEQKEKGWLGVSTRDMTPKLARSMDVKANEGALVKDVIEDSPAEEAGIREDDIIVEFNGSRISDADDLLKAVRKTRPGTSVSILVSRDDQQTPLKATLGKASEWLTMPALPRMPDIPHIRVHPPRLSMSRSVNSYGLWVRDLNKQLGKYFGAPRGRGVLVEEVEEGSSADSAGFQAGDVIIKVQDEEVTRTGDIWDALKDMKEGEAANVEVIRRGNSQKLSLRVDEMPRRGKWFRSRSFELPDFDNEDFRQQMKQLQEELRDVGKEVQSQARKWAKQLRKELRHVTT